jgi:hypothetical protein
MRFSCEFDLNREIKAWHCEIRAKGPRAYRNNLFLAYVFDSQGIEYVLDSILYFTLCRRRRFAK